MIRLSTYLANLDIKARFAVMTLTGILSSLVLIFITRQGGFFPSGFMGLSLALESFIGEAWALPLFMFATNFPLAVMSFFKVGKKFALLGFWYTIVTTTVYTLLSRFVSESFSLFDVAELGNIGNRLLVVIIGGTIYAFTLSVTYMVKGCAGGIDYISMYVTTVKKKPFAVWSAFISGITMLLIVFFSIFLKEGIETNVWSFYNMFNNTLYLTFIFIVLSNYMVHNLYPRYKKVVVTIVTSNGYELSRYLVRRNYPHKHTYSQTRSSSSGKTRTQIRIVILYNQYSDLLKRVKSIDEKAFLTVNKMLRVDGNITEPKFD